MMYAMHSYHHLTMNKINKQWKICCCMGQYWHVGGLVGGSVFMSTPAWGKDKETKLKTI